MTDANHKTILRIASFSPLRQILDYLLPKHIDPNLLHSGMRVKIPLGNRDVIGVLLETAKTTDIPQNKLKSIKEVLDMEPVMTAQILKLCRWASDYYHYPLGEVLQNALPVLLRRDKPIKKDIIQLGQSTKLSAETHNKTKPLKLNAAQKKATAAMIKNLDEFNCFLLNGITGSGKTEVYLHVIQKVLEKNQQAMVLVPEIALTPQTLERFQRRFAVPIAVLHSRLNDKQRLIAWMQAKSGTARIILGTRSAIFTPCENLSLIVIDEEHDLSFKQQSGFRYSARNLAIMRASFESIPIVLGSATPALETLYNAKTSRYKTLFLPERAGNAVHPNYFVIDVRNEQLYHGLSKSLLKAIKRHLKQNSQILLFLNRRGYAPTLMCHVCGWTAVCSHCDAHMTLHQCPPRLHCHHCDTKYPIQNACPSCRSMNLQTLGVGTEHIEEGLKQYFPDVPISRIDRDTTQRKNAIADLLEDVQKGDSRILIGTQMLAKGHHFPNVTLVGIINADSGFFSADFRAAERIGQLLVQVSGRAGRAEKSGEVFIQTHHPQHPLLLQLIKKGYMEFAELALHERQESQLPPYSYLALLRAEAIKKQSAEAFLLSIKKIAQTATNKNVKILGPIPSAMLRRKNHFHYQLLFQSASRTALQILLKDIMPKIEKIKSQRQVRWSLDVDPLEMR